VTSTTPESRGRIAYTGYLRSIHNRGPIPETVPSFDDLPEAERLAWVNSARVIWEIATTGRSSL
jgi:hypothetical protein